MGDGWDPVGGLNLQRIEDGCLVVEGGTPAQIEAPVSGDGWDIEVTVTASNTGSNARFGIVFGRQEGGGAVYGYAAIALPSQRELPEHVWVGTRHANGGLASIDAQDQGELPGDGRGPLRLRVRGEAGHVEVYISGVLLVSADGVTTAGRLGLFSEHSTACFDDIVVR